MKKKKYIGLLLILAFIVIIVSSCKKDDDADKEPVDNEDLASILAGSYTGKASDEWGENSKERSIFVSRLTNKTINVKPEGTNITNSEFDLLIIRKDEETILHDESEDGITFKAIVKNDSIYLEFIMNNPQQSFKGVKK